ncbi:hypothetical protein K435DRAFT_862405 [Dendrothele bispora CBS 962.96]|uniref:Uncharacterized protein n=1 Tax=Dendrothele bispora (strain CBS 962.96) TaxID=1314807 RepID=A0A4S8LSL8_DENBC|nr:hypothetical protein K435DRAFT_862405 [Dendrothele bispora CBS 962.96]
MGVGKDKSDKTRRAKAIQSQGLDFADHKGAFFGSCVAVNIQQQSSQRSSRMDPSLAGSSRDSELRVLQTDSLSLSALTTLREPPMKPKVREVQRLIFEEGLSVTSERVKKLLDPESLTATLNAPSEAFREYGFNMLKLITNDILHESEVGEWKRIFMHLVRILKAFDGNNSTSILNKRYRQVPTFGHGTIRRFSNDVSAMRKLAGWDFEDMLLCAIPCFEGLLPEPHNSIVLDLLFDYLIWHGYAKLEMSYDNINNPFRQATNNLGTSIRRFANMTCTKFDTWETQRERAGRLRRVQRQQEKLSPSTAIILTSQSSLKRRYNASTPKLHAHGYYADDVPYFGTCNSHTTRISETEHRRVKKMYKRTNKRGHDSQIGRQVVREQFFYDIRPADRSLVSREKESMDLANPAIQYHIGTSQKCFVDIDTFLYNSGSDPSRIHFARKLKDHLLGRIFGEEQLEYPEERQYLTIVDDRLYRHQLVRFNYTTYDVRRNQDSINPRSRPHVMCLSSESSDSAHPYVYARVCGVFHVNTRYRGPGSYDSSTTVRRFDVLWVCWLIYDTSSPAGFQSTRLHRVFFPSGFSSDAFGFLDPARVLRAAHIIPAFASGQTSALLPVNSIARQMEIPATILEGNAVDRNMFMRFRGGGIGHKSTRVFTKQFEQDATETPIDHNAEDDLKDQVSTKEAKVTEKPLTERFDFMAEDDEEIQLFLDYEEDSEWEQEQNDGRDDSDFDSD